MPGAAHATELTMPPGVPRSREALPGTSSAVPQVPPVSSTTNDWVLKLESVYKPPALQLPVPVHEIELIWASPAVLSGPVPGTSAAVPQVPLVSLTTNACVVDGVL